MSFFVTFFIDSPSLLPCDVPCDSFFECPLCRIHQFTLILSFGKGEEVRSVHNFVNAVFQDITGWHWSICNAKECNPFCSIMRPKLKTFKQHYFYLKYFGLADILYLLLTSKLAMRKRIWLTRAKFMLNMASK